MSESESPAHCSYEGCTRPVHGGTSLCIFHAPADKKAPQEFRNALAAQIREWRKPPKAKVWDFRGWVFVDREPNVQWSGDTYNMFCRAIFPVDASFREAKFCEPVCFNSSKFIGKAFFETAQFMRYTYFKSTQFMQNSLFQSARFTGHAYFQSAQFLANADFQSVQFMGHAYFQSTQFTGNVDFQSSRFSGCADFDSAQFAGNARFWHAQFMPDANFGSAQFTGNADFRSVQFERRAYFRRAQFRGNADFANTTFLDTAAFDFAKFERANFDRAAFRASVSFFEINFLEIDLSYAVFAVEGHMRLVDLKRRAVVRWPGPGKRYDQHGNEMKRGTFRLCVPKVFGQRGFVDLRGNVLNDDTTLVLEECDMSRILLGRLDWMRLRIIAPSWECLGGRRVIGDEYVPRKLLRRSFVQGLVEHFKGSICSSMPDADIRFDPTSVADTYLLLTKRFREDLKHAWANDFNCGAFAMNRLAPPNQSCLGQKLCSVLKKETHIAPLRWLKAGLYGLLVLLKRYLSLTALYGVSAGYGRSILRPIVWLILVNLLAGLSYKGLREPDWFIPKIASLRDMYDLGTAAFSNAISVVTFRESPARLVNPAFSSKATVIGAVQIVLAAVTGALAVFAIRRRFRHG
jgi:uncharacterized protein YjbI with pentapeptide repeats